MSGLAAIAINCIGVGICLVAFYSYTFYYSPDVWQLALADCNWNCIQSSLFYFVYSQFKYMSGLAAIAINCIGVGICLIAFYSYTFYYSPNVWQLSLTDFYWDCIQSSLFYFVYSQLKYVGGLAATIFHCVRVGICLIAFYSYTFYYSPNVWQLSLTDFYWDCIQSSLSCFIYGQC